jgi:glycosyltransferase involved in cell wall biosynthesis
VTVPGPHSPTHSGSRRPWVPDYAATGPLRILHVVEAFESGVYEVVRQLGQRHSAVAGLEVAIAHSVRSHTPADLEHQISNDVELFPLPWTSRSLGSQLRAARRLREIIATWGPSVGHFHSSFATFVGALAAGSSLPTVASPHGYSFLMEDRGRGERALYRLIEFLTSRRATLVGAASVSEAETARKVLKATNVVTVPNGIPELDRIPAERAIVSKSHRVVAMGRPVPQRRPEACARILRAVRERGDVLWIGGGSAEGLGARALTAANITQTGWLDRARVLELLRGARVYLHWTGWDGLALSILEAMACDAVVVASDIPPNREILGDEQVCRSERQATDLILRVLTDDDYAQQLLLQQNRRRQAYAGARMANSWLTVYRALAKEDSPEGDERPASYG